MGGLPDQTRPVRRGRDGGSWTPSVRPSTTPKGWTGRDGGPSGRRTGLDGLTTTKETHGESRNEGSLWLACRLRTAYSSPPRASRGAQELPHRARRDALVRRPAGAQAGPRDQPRGRGCPAQSGEPGRGGGHLRQALRVPDRARRGGPGPGLRVVPAAAGAFAGLVPGGAEPAAPRGRNGADLAGAEQVLRVHGVGAAAREAGGGIDRWLTNY